jgi:cyclopropane fatty-acyl-phospholipid synthase-like methyltransferase
MKIKKCRSCNSDNLKPAFDIGVQKFTGVFLKTKNEKVPEGSLALVFCDNCNLLQLQNSFDPNIMYGSNYGYMSSLNQSMVNHLKVKAEKINRLIDLNPGDIIMDIGSNDGTFLKFFSKKLKLIGVDPTIKKLKNYYRKDIIKVPNFFSKSNISKIINKKIKVVLSISMFYDLEDPVNFAQEIFETLDDNGIWHLEQSYMPLMLKNNSYDTICHEHLEYYSLKSIKYIFDKVGFKIIDLQFNDINGGSFAVTVAKKKSKFKEASIVVDWLLKKEELFKYNNLSSFKKFFIDIEKHKIIFRDLLLNLKDSKKKVIGYGASTKGNVILQYCNINQELIPYIAEVNKFKHGRYTPGSKIKIISEQQAKKMSPDYFIVFPWHFKNFIINKEKKFIKRGKKIIFPLPDIEII